jgi:hypothetical protein
VSTVKPPRTNHDIGQAKEHDLSLAYMAVVQTMSVSGYAGS